MSKKYSEALRRAISVLKRKELSISRAAKEFNIPRMTVNDRVKNLDIGPKKGLQKQLTKEKDSLVSYVLYMAGQGCTLTRRMIRCYVQEIVRRSGM